MVDSGGVPGKGIILASIEKLFRRVPKTGHICVSTEKGSNPAECREKVESVRVSKKCQDEYRKRVQSMCVPKNCRIRASTEKMQNPFEYLKNCLGEYRKEVE